MSEDVKSVSGFRITPCRDGHSVMKVSRNLSRKVVLITGAAHGIGAQVARDLVGAGASVAILDRDVAGAQRLVAELGSRCSGIRR